MGQGVLAEAAHANVVFCQLSPWQYEHKTLLNLRRTFRRSSCLLARLLANMGAAGDTSILERFGSPVDPSRAETRWLEDLYMDVPQAWDDLDRVSWVVLTDFEAGQRASADSMTALLLAVDAARGDVAEFRDRLHGVRVVRAQTLRQRRAASVGAAGDAPR